MDIQSRGLKRSFLISMLIILCLIMASAMTFFGLSKDASVLAATSSFVEVDELLIDGYESKPQNSKIFNADSLADLFEKLTGNSNSTITDVKNLGTKDASYFRNLTANGGKDITVKLGDKRWTVTYLTQEGGDVILDLWLDQRDALFDKWNDTTVDNSAVPGNYPPNMYGVSKMRSVVLNNGGEYYKDQSNLYPAYTPVITNTFAIYTMPYSASYTASIRDFIVQPKDITYQATENSYGITLDTPSHGNYTRNNEAYDTITTNAYWYTNGSGIKYCYENKTNYSKWKDDYIWLPSTAEVGNGDGVNGIWKVSVEQKKWSSRSIWLRTAREVNAPGVHIITGSTGTTLNATDCANQMLTRPAFHLNLSKVAAYASKPVTAPDINNLEKIFDGSEQGVEDEDWYIDEDLENIATVTYYDKNTSSAIATKPKVVGNYEVEITLNSDDYYWTDDVNNLTLKIPFNIVKKKIPYPKFIDGEDKLPYNGGDDVYFQLETFDDYISYIDIKVPSNYGSDVKYNGTSQSFTAKKVGTYEMTV
ncbi:MAG: hypothetical protein K2J89_01915, partial [Clostridia bacterium]|nr:hypothetical protein [Clostridia bacterium]